MFPGQPIGWVVAPGGQAEPRIAVTTKNPADGNVTPMEIREVRVIGLGTVGAGIAEVFARAGIPVTAVEADGGALAPPPLLAQCATSGPSPLGRAGDG